MTESESTTIFDNPSGDAITRRNRFVLPVARVALLGLWFIATLQIARILGPAAFGIYWLCQNAIRIVTGCVSDPLDMAVMREAPIYFRSQPSIAMELIRSAFWLRITAGVLCSLAAAAVPGVVSWLIFDSPDYKLLALFTALGIVGDLLLRSSLGFFQASERFGSFMLVDMLWQLSRVVTVAVLWLCGALTMQAAIILYVAAPFAAFALAIMLFPAEVRKPVLPHPDRLRGVLHYSKWMAAVTVMAVIAERLDIFMLKHFRSDHEVGIYGGAMALALIPDFLNSSIQTVLSPRIAPAFADGQFIHLRNSYLKLAVPAGLLAAVIAWLIGGPVIKAFLSTRYVESIDAFKVLILATLFNAVMTPLSSPLVSYVRPKLAMIVSGLSLVIVGGVGVVLIPRYGVMGASMLILITRVIVGSILFVIADRLARIGRAALNEKAHG